MPYNFAADSFHTKKLCSRLSSSEVRFFTQIGCFAFLGPPLGDLGATYDDYKNNDVYNIYLQTSRSTKLTNHSAPFTPDSSVE